MYDQSETELLRLLADRAGIAADYYDIAGTRHVTTDETRRALLAALNFRAADRLSLIDELFAWDNRPWTQSCDPVRVVRLGQDPGQWSLHLPCGESDEGLVQVHWTLCGEDGRLCAERNEGPGLRVEERRVINDRRWIRLAFALPQDLPLGYYQMVVSARGGTVNREAAFRLIVAPDRCYVPEALQRGTRLWGVALQLYSLRSNRNWGIGDFQDLATLVDWTGKQGATVIGLNPLHALKNSMPYHISPYSPNSRLFLNELYIDVEQVVECQTSAEVRRLLADPSFLAQIEKARTSEFVEYDIVASVKRTALDLCYRSFLRDNFDGGEPELKPHTERGRRFSDYVREEGAPLAHFALFQALEEDQQKMPTLCSVWTDWPAPYRIADAEAVEEFRRRHMDRVRFFQYLQWLAADQLRGLVAKTGESGMTIGLYHDLALGSNRDGADGWRFQDVLAMTADCGAPPDAFAPEGQNWGFSPADPFRLRATGYQYFIELLRNNLRFGGAIRLDHVMALFRLFWIPRGCPASIGTYVHYPADELLAILALESVRAKALVIGEDLGTVPDWVRERLGSACILSYRVFYFERTGPWTWKQPGAYPTQSLGVVTTHDLPTLTGYWEGRDIDTRAQLGLFSSEEARRRMLAERQQEKAGILAALRTEGLLPPDHSDDPAHVPVMTAPLAESIHLYLARTPAWVVLANIEDVIGIGAQTNVPGTVDQQPNWRRKLSLTVDDLTHDPRFERLAAQLRSVRPLV
jgi:4-alpha-glucanotransferase